MTSQKFICDAGRERAQFAEARIEKTRLVAPFDGVVSERRVSVGDTAQIGKELLKVIDPLSMPPRGLEPLAPVMANRR